jgi:hypothetical protein
MSQDEPESEPVVINVGGLAFLRTMCSLIWTAFLHPMGTTYIDVETGRVVNPENDEALDVLPRS